MAHAARTLLVVLALEGRSTTWGLKVTLSTLGANTVGIDGAPGG
jgi:hypothetical protein